MGIHDWFFSEVITSRQWAVPVKALWGVEFTAPNVSEISSYESGWSVGNITSPKQGYVMALAQGVSIPGEGFNAIRSGPENITGIRGVLGNGRKEFDNLGITFLETNKSFTDLVMRPWAALAGYKGMAMGWDLKKDITVRFFDVADFSGSGGARKTFVFKNCVPVNIASENYAYTAGRELSLLQVDFVYTNYTVQ